MESEVESEPLGRDRKLKLRNSDSLGRDQTFIPRSLDGTKSWTESLGRGSQGESSRVSERPEVPGEPRRSLETTAEPSRPQEASGEHSRPQDPPGPPQSTA